MLTKKFGSSKDPEYLEKQAASLVKHLDNEGWKMSHGTVSNAYETIDELRWAAFSIQNPQKAAEILQERQMTAGVENY